MTWFLWKLKNIANPWKYWVKRCFFQQTTEKVGNIGFGTIGFDNLIKIIYNERLEGISRILETPYVTKEDSSKDKVYPPYKYEIEMIRNKEFDSELITKIREG